VQVFSLFNEGHKPPIFNDNAPGRYASALFIAASKKDGLQAVLEDLHHLREVIETQPSIR
jgi:F0F1-type ATP synthase delta subunit